MPKPRLTVTVVTRRRRGTWGRTWLLPELGTTTFRVRIIDASTMSNRDFSLDYLAVSVTYAP